MGLFSGIKNIVSNVAKNPVSTIAGGLLGGMAGGPLGSVIGGGVGSGGMGGLKDTLLGEKDMGTADRRYDLDPSLKKVVEAGRPKQTQALGILGGQLGKWGGMDTKAMAGAMAGQEERMLRSQSQDAIRSAGSNIARRGLGNSSLGLRAQLGAEKDLAKGVNAVRASLPIKELELNQQQLAGINSATGGINSILGTPGAQSTIVPGTPGTGMRSGGLLGIAAPIAGGIFGGMYGGPQGASAGMGVGSGISNIFRSF